MTWYASAVFYHNTPPTHINPPERVYDGRFRVRLAHSLYLTFPKKLHFDSLDDARLVCIHTSVGMILMWCYNRYHDRCNHRTAARPEE